MCNFRLANLCSSPLPFNRSDDRFDVILLRNVMLYFSQETRKTLLAGIHKLLAPDGILIPRLQRAARRSLHLDPCAGRRHLPLPPSPAQLAPGFTDLMKDHEPSANE